MLIFFMFNPFIPNAPFLYPLKTLENILVYWCFQAAERGCMGNKWVKCLWLKSDVKKPQRNKLISNINPNFDIGLYHQKITPNFPDVSLLLLKGSLYSSFYILAVSQSCFLTYLDATFKTCHTFSERLKFVVFKIEKTALKNLNKEEHGQSDNENLKPLKELLYSYCQHFLDFFSIDGSYYYLIRFFQKILLMASLMVPLPPYEKWPTLIKSDLTVLEKTSDTFKVPYYW